LKTQGTLIRSSFPGKLDCMVGGGIDAFHTPMETILKESAEEASLVRRTVQPLLRQTGIITISLRSPAGWLLPGLYYTFDAQLPADQSIRPTLNASDGEVESFELLSASEVHKALMEGQFKPSSALAMIDFFVRHGIVTADNDPRYADICVELRRDLGVQIPW